MLWTLESHGRKCPSFCTLELHSSVWNEKDYVIVSILQYSSIFISMKKDYNAKDTAFTWKADEVLSRGTALDKMYEFSSFVDFYENSSLTTILKRTRKWEGLPVLVRLPGFIKFYKNLPRGVFFQKMSVMLILTVN